MKNFLNETGLELLWTHIVSFVTGKSNTALNEAKTYTDEAVNTAISNIEIPSTEGLASENYVNTKVSELVNSAPETLNTLNELATALGDDPNFATTIATQIGTKIDATEVERLLSFKVPTTRTINGQSLLNNVYLSASDIDAMSSTNPKGTGSLSLNRKANSEIGDGSVAIGYNTEATGNYSCAEGDRTIASGRDSHAEGIETIASGQHSHAEGSTTIAFGNNSHAENNRTIANGSGSHAEGGYTVASGLNSHAEGMGYQWDITISGEGNTLIYNVSTIPNEIEVGMGIIFNNVSAIITEFNKENSTITLSNTLSSETLSTVIVKLCYGAFGINSHTEGRNTIAEKEGAHAEGYHSRARGHFSHAEGYYSEANGLGSHAEGSYTIADGTYSHAEGRCTYAAVETQHVQGKYNIINTTYAHIVGNGESETARSNAHTLDWSGNAWYQGDVYIGGTSQSDANKLATENYVDEKFETIEVPVNSVNGKTGEVVLTANDIGALPDTTEIPSIAGLASENYVDIKVSELVNSAPETLNTLNELATALGNDPNFATTVANQIGTKANSSDLTSHTGNKTNPHNVTTTQIGAMSATDPTGTGSLSVNRLARTNIGSNSCAIGTSTRAQGNSSCAMGYYTQADGDYSFAMGKQAYARGNSSVAFGDNNIAIGNYSYTEGSGLSSGLSLTGEANTKVYTYSESPFVESRITEGLFVSYKNSYAQIIQLDKDNRVITLTSSLSSEALNATTVTIFLGGASVGTSSHVEGECTTAGGDYSHSEGECTIAGSKGQHVQGRYNITDTSNTHAHIVGNGRSYSLRSNAHTLDWDGNAWYSGDVYVGSTSGTNKDEGSKKLATEEYVNNLVRDSLTLVDQVTGQRYTICMRDGNLVSTLAT